MPHVPHGSCRSRKGRQHVEEDSNVTQEARRREKKNEKKRGHAELSAGGSREEARFGCLFRSYACVWVKLRAAMQQDKDSLDRSMEVSAEYRHLKPGKLLRLACMKGRLMQSRRRTDAWRERRMWAPQHVS